MRCFVIRRFFLEYVYICISHGRLVVRLNGGVRILISVPLLLRHFHRESIVTSVDILVDQFIFTYNIFIRINTITIFFIVSHIFLFLYHTHTSFFILLTINFKNLFFFIREKIPRIALFLIRRIFFSKLEFCSIYFNTRLF